MGEGSLMMVEYLCVCLCFTSGESKSVFTRTTFVGQNRPKPVFGHKCGTCKPLPEQKKTKHAHVLSHKSHVTLVSQWYHSDPSRQSKRIVSPAPSSTNPIPSLVPSLRLHSASTPPAGILPPPDARCPQLDGQGRK